MRDKKIFVLKIVWRKSIPSLHRLTQAVQRANLRRTAGDPTWVFPIYIDYKNWQIKIVTKSSCFADEIQIEIIEEFCYHLQNSNRRT